MKPNDIVLVPMEESPTMLGTWARLKHFGRVKISTHTIGSREFYRTTLEHPDGRTLSDENEDLYRTFLNIYRRVVKKEQMKKAKNGQPIVATSNHLIYDKVEKVWHPVNDVGNCQNIW